MTEQTVDRAEAEAETHSIAARLWKNFQAWLAKGDDPICLAALDETTLGRFRYSERQIVEMKERSYPF